MNLTNNNYIIKQTNSFKRVVKKLYTNQKKELDKAVREVLKNPHIGAAKKGDLYGVKVYKFNMINQLTLLAYNYDTHSNVITLLALGTHEGFYKDLKLSI